MNEKPSVNYPDLLGRMFGLVKSRAILTEEQFNEAFQDILAEYTRQEQAVNEWLQKPVTQDSQ